MGTRFIWLCLLCLCASARADWVELSVAFICDKESGVFALAPVIETSDQFTLQAPSMYEPLPGGVGKDLECSIKNHVVHLHYTAVGPSERGRCRGIGFTEIRLLEVDGKRQIGGEIINSGCFDQPTLIGVSIKVESRGLSIERCTVEPPGGEPEYKGHICNRKPLEP